MGVAPEDRGFNAHPETGGLSLALGTLFLTYAARLCRALLASRRRLPAASFGTFAVAEWGGALVLFSEKSLSLTGPGVHEVRCGGTDARDRFRYDGLKLIFPSGNQYLFLPAGWTHDDGAAIILPRGDSLRLEFSAADRPVVHDC